MHKVQHGSYEICKHTCTHTRVTNSNKWTLKRFDHSNAWVTQRDTRHSRSTLEISMWKLQGTAHLSKRGFTLCFLNVQAPTIQSFQTSTHTREIHRLVDCCLCHRHPTLWFGMGCEKCRWLLHYDRFSAIHRIRDPCSRHYSSHERVSLETTTTHHLPWLSRQSPHCLIMQRSTVHNDSNKLFVHNSPSL